ncbi:hypothetical protein LTR95_016704 [Oleoguttula sp. CCFEE 5521]
MAHQAHAVPWNALTSHFRYIEVPGIAPDIYVLDTPDRLEAMLFFARAFAKNIREYAAVERKKYATPTEFRRRAATWTKSERWPVDQKHAAETGGTKVRKKSTKVIETRKLFSDAEGDVWGSRHSRYVGPSGFSDETWYIDDWIMGDKHWARIEDFHEMYRKRDEWVGDWTDTIKGLMMEAALVLTPLNARQGQREDPKAPFRRHTDTLFLLAHQPRIDLMPWTHEGDSCCNMESGLICIIEAALTGYLYLNILSSMRESDSSVCDLTDHVVDRPQKVHNRGRYRTLLRPRPKFMNTRSWTECLTRTCNPHEHHPEVMMFEPFFYPRPGGGAWGEVGVDRAPNSKYSRYDTSRFEEVNIMASDQVSSTDAEIEPLLVRGSLEALREFLRGLGKLMVNYEMLWKDQGHPPKWEVMVADALEQSFCRFKGKSKTYRNSLLWDSYLESCVLRVEDLFDPELCKRKWAEYNDEDWVQELALVDSEVEQQKSTAKPRREGKRRARLRAHGGR